MDAVLFDLFGTLIPNVSPARLREGLDELADALGADRDAFGREWGRGFRHRMDGTLRDGPDMFRPVLAALGVEAPADLLAEADRRRRAFFAAEIRPKPDALATLEALRARGCRLALVSDCSSGTPALLDACPLGPFFPVRAISADLRTRKPDPVMYRTALDGLGVDPARALYVGDGNSEELPGAKRLGMTTVWVDNGDAQHWRDRFSSDADHAVRDLAEIPALVDRLRNGGAA